MARKREPREVPESVTAAPREAVAPELGDGAAAADRADDADIDEVEEGARPDIDEASATEVKALRSLHSAQHGERIDQAKKLIRYGLRSTVVEAMTGLTKTAIGRLMKIAGRAGVRGRPVQNFGATMSPASKHMESTLFALLWQHKARKAPNPAAAVTPAALITTWELFARYVAAPRLSIDEAHLIAVEFSRGNAAFATCRHHQQYIVPTTAARVAGYYTQGKCPWCRSENTPTRPGE